MDVSTVRADERLLALCPLRFFDNRAAVPRDAVQRSQRVRLAVVQLQQTAAERVDAACAQRLQELRLVRVHALDAAADRVQQQDAAGRPPSRTITMGLSKRDRDTPCTGRAMVEAAAAEEEVEAEGA